MLLLNDLGLSSTKKFWRYLKETVKSKFDGDLVQWCELKEVRLPHSVRYPIFVPEEAPWLLEPMRALTDPNITRVDVRGPAGSAKSLIGELHIAYCIENDPGLYYYVWQSDADAQDAMEDRIIPMLDDNVFLSERLPSDPRKKRVTKISFPRMPLYAVGANISNAQSKRARYLTMEEPHLYRPGMMSAFEKRTEGVRERLPGIPDFKILTLSTGSVLDDQSDKAFNDGTCEEWEVPCPYCNQYQAMVDSRDRLRADKTEETIDEKGNFIWSKLLGTVRYNCLHCGRDWPKDQEFRRSQGQLGRYNPTNPNANPKHRSFHWEAVSVHWIYLTTLVEEKLKASYTAKRGSIDLLKEYIQKRRALAWDESPPEDDQDISRMYGAYVKREKNENEIARFLTIDNQAGKSSKGEGAHRWFVCRSYGETESRLIDCGKIISWEQVEELRASLEVHPLRTLVDMAFATQQVQAICVRYGYQALWGDNTNKKSFPHHEMLGNQKITRHMPFSPVNLGHLGKSLDGRQAQARYFFWCQQPIKDLYHRLKSGLTLYQWSVFQDTPKEYFDHQVEYKRQEIDGDGNKKWIWVTPPKKDNHLLDCDQMNLVAAIMDPRLRQILYAFPDENVKSGEECNKEP